MNINMSLTDFEIEMLNKLMHKHEFEDYSILEHGLRDLVSEQKEAAIASGVTTEQDFQSFQNKTVSDIAHFLKHNDFFAEREGRVFFLTERGKQLEQQGSIQKYLEWEKGREAQLLADLHTIETKGYLNKDQTFSPETKPVDKEFNYRILWYILILAAIFLLWRYGRSMM